MNFLGYRVFPQGSQLARASRRRFLRRWAWCEGARERGRIGDAEAQRRVLALGAFVRVARRERVLQRTFRAGSQRPGTGTRPSGSHRVNRGGSWNSDAGNCRSANRNRNSPGKRNHNLGFRLALSSRPRLRARGTAGLKPAGVRLRCAR